MVIKICAKCGAETDEFTSSKRSKDGFRPRCKRCESEDRKDVDKRNKLKVIRYYSNGTFECECCHEKRLEFLTVDHVDGSGAEARKNDPGQYRICRWVLKNKFPPGFRILCMNCNFSIGVWGYCPHSSESKFTKDIISRIDKPKRCQGIQCRSAKIDESDVKEIRSLFVSGTSVRELMNKFSINESSVRKILKNKTWKHVK